MASSTMGQKIRALRIKRGWKREDLAEQLAVSAVTIWKWEHNEVNLSSSRIIQLATLFDVPPGFFYQRRAKPATTPKTEAIDAANGHKEERLG